MCNLLHVLILKSILVPFKKFLLPEDHVSKPIPTLSERQFIVDKTKMSTSEVQMQRELFWYREELFKHITGRWQEVGALIKCFAID
jgi:trafficking protein particle complex subunit 9